MNHTTQHWRTRTFQDLTRELVHTTQQFNLEPDNFDQHMKNKNTQLNNSLVCKNILFHSTGKHKKTSLNTTLENNNTPVNNQLEFLLNFTHHCSGEQEHFNQGLPGE